VLNATAAAAAAVAVCVRRICDAAVDDRGVQRGRGAASALTAVANAGESMRCPAAAKGLLMASAYAACSLPRAGPSKRMLYNVELRV